MDELNLQEIEKKLNEQFANGQRLIFWYDADASFETEVDRLQLGDVRILHLTENNAFRTKLLLEHEDTEGQYLIYAPFEKPAVAKNHLEDTLLYSREFYADRLSLIAAEIGIPSRLRGSLESLKTFFAADGGKRKAQERQAGIRRTNAFMERAREMDLSAASAENLSVIAMCVISKARNTATDDLFYSVFSYGDIDAQEVVTEFARNGLDREFWKLCESRFGYQDSHPKLLKFTLSLFAVYTCREDFALLPKAWETYAQDSMRRKASNISVLLENMMNNVLYQECFDEISLTASRELQVESMLGCFPREELLHMNSFATIDDMLISWMIDRELAEDKNAAISGKSIPDICEERLRRHFGSGKKAEYAALLSGYRLLHGADFMPKETLQELIDSYCEKDYWIDTEYRKFIAALDAMEDTTAFEKLTDLIQNIYITDYLEKIVYKWNAALEKNGLHNSAIANIAGEQRKFYQDKVAPMKEKVAVIISDGLRYEAAKELEARLSEDENTDVSMSAMLAAPPTVTSVGMGRLLPHERMELTEDKTPKVLLDGLPSASTAQRETILKKANENSAAVDYDTVKDMKSKELQELSLKKKVIYIYHNRIDATGEAPRTENSVFDAVEKSVEELFRLVKTLSRSGNIYRFLITADHGFLYTRRKLQPTDKLENVAGRDALWDRRFLLDREKAGAEGIYALSMADVLGNSDGRYLMLAKGMSVFRCGGGMNYVHGGASPQEMIIPSIFVKTQKGLVEIESANLNLITDIRKVTNLKLRLDFYQEQPVSDTVKAATYRIRFEADTGEILSNEVIHLADRKEEKPGERIVTLGFDIKRKAYGADHRYFLKIFRTGDKGDLEVMSRQVIMDLPFTDDYGFGF